MFAGGVNPDTLDPRFLKAMQNLNKLKPTFLEEYVRLVLEFLQAPKTFDVVGELERAGKKHGVTSSSFIKETLRGSLILFRGMIKHSMTSAQIRVDLKTLGIEEKCAELIASRWKKNIGYIKASTVASALQVHQLVDMEWKFGVTASTNELGHVGTTFLQLKLKIAKGDEIENVHLELTLPQFYKLLGQLEKVKSLMDLMS